MICLSLCLLARFNHRHKESLNCYPNYCSMSCTKLEVSNNFVSAQAVARILASECDTLHALGQISIRKLDQSLFSGEKGSDFQPDNRTLQSTTSGGSRKRVFQTIKREARGVKSAPSAKNLGLRPLPCRGSPIIDQRGASQQPRLDFSTQPYHGDYLDCTKKLSRPYRN